MKLESLIPSLRLACSVALANHQVGNLTENSALAVAFRRSDEAPEILYVPDVEKLKVLSHYVYAASLLAQPLASVTDAVAGLGTTHEQAVEKMAAILLPNLPRLIYETKLTDPRIIALANVLDGYALAGIVNGIAATENQPQPPSLKPCTAPERN